MGKQVKHMNKIQYFEYYNMQLKNYIMTNSGARKVSINDFDKVIVEVDRISQYIQSLKDIEELSLEEKKY